MMNDFLNLISLEGRSRADGGSMVLFFFLSREVVDLQHEIEEIVAVHPNSFLSVEAKGEKK